MALCRRLGNPKSRRLHVFSDNVAGSQQYRVHNPDVDTLARGLLSRVFFRKDGTPPRVPLWSDVSLSLKAFDDRINKFLPAAKRVSAEEFVSMYKHTPRKFANYERARKSLEVKGVSRLDARVKSFTKAEKIDMADCAEDCIVDEDKKDPRVISPRDPRYNIEVGRFLKPLEKALCQAITRAFREPTVFKGMNAREQGRQMRKKWDKYRDPVAIGLDASRFDQHCSLEMLTWEHNVYLRCFQGREREILARLLSWQLVNVGRGYCADGVVKYTTRGTRQSGDMNTGMGNCLMMCAMVYSYADLHNIKLSLANNGDDCVVILERHAVERFIAGIPGYFRTLGYVMKVEEPVDVFEKIEFCQTQPVRTGTHSCPEGPDSHMDTLLDKEHWETCASEPQPSDYVMVRSYPRTLAKDMSSLKPLNTRGSWDTMRSSVAHSGLALTSGVPIFQAFYKMLGRGTDGQVDKDPTMTGMKYLARGLLSKESEVTDEARVSFFHAFGITPARQCAIERHYAEVSLKYSNPVPVDIVNKLEII